MTTSGRLLAVITKTLGAPLTLDHPAGTTTLAVARTVDLSADGGWVQVGTDTLRYASIDRYAKTVTLIDPLTADAFTDDLVAVWDPDLLRVATELECQVQPDGDDDTADPIFAEVEHQLQPYLPTGILDAPYPVVTLERFEDGWIVKGGPRAETPQFDGQAVWNPHSRRTFSGQVVSDNAAEKLLGWADVETDGVSFSSGRWTIVIPAWYEMTAGLTWAPNATGRRRVRIVVNGVVVAIGVQPADPDIETYVDKDHQMRLHEGDYVEVWAYQHSGANLSVTDGTFVINRASS